MSAKKGTGTGTEVARISVKVTPDTKKFRGDLKEELTKIEREIKGDIEVKAHLDKAKAKEEFDAFLKGLRAQGKNGVKIKTHLVEDGKGLGDGKGRRNNNSDGVNEAKKAANLFQKIASKFTEAPSFGSGINLTGYLLIFTALSAVLAPMAGVITGLLMSLPGLIALVATPISALMLGLEGIKRAAAGLAQPFTDLKNSMSAAVEGQFTPVFERLGGIFPTLAEHLPKVTQGLADMLSGTLDAAVGAKGLDMIGSTIDNIGAALSSMQPGIRGFTDGIMTLANNFSGGALTGIADWFNKIGTSFDAFITKLDATGELDTVFSNLGAILGVLFDSLVKIAGIGIDFLNDPEAVMTFMVILKGVTSTLEFFFSASKAFLHAIGAVFINVAMWITQLQVKLSSIITTIVGIATQVGSSLVSAFSSFVATATQVWSSIVTTVSSAIQTVISTVQNLPAMISGIWGNIVATASSAWEGVKNAVSTAWNAIVSAIQTAISTVVSVVSGWGGQIISIITSIDLLSAGKALIQRFIDGISSMAGAVVGAAKKVFGGLMNLIPHSPAKEGPFSGAGWTSLKTGGEAVVEQFGKGLENGFVPVLEQAKSMASRVADAFANGGDPTAALQGLSPKEVTRMEKVLKFQSSDMGRQIKALEWQAKQAGKGPLADSLKARADELKLIRDGVDAQREMLDLTNEYNDANSSGSSGNVFLDAINEFMKLPNGFFGATANQAMQDLGISGNGALQAVAGYGADLIGKGVTNIFNTSNVDDTMALFQNQTNRQSQGIVGR